MPDSEERVSRVERFRALYNFDASADISSLVSEAAWRGNARVERLGVPLFDHEGTEILYRNDLLAAAEPTINLLRAQRPEVFGRVYMDHASGGVVAVGVTDRSVVTEVETMLGAALPEGRFRVDVVATSWSDIRLAADAVSAGIASGELSDAGTIGVAVDDINQQLIVTVDRNVVGASPDTSGLEASVRSYSGAPEGLPIEFEIAEPGDGDASLVYGGHALRTCTAGFAVRDSSGTEFNITSGHCPDNQRHHHGGLHGGFFYANSAHSSWAANGGSHVHYDYQLQNSWAHHNNGGGLLYNPGTGSYTSISTQVALPWSFSDSTQATNCAYGNTSLVLCGPVAFVSFGFTHSGYYQDWMRAIWTVIYAQLGDSGGPVYTPLSNQPDRPVGITDGFRPSWDPNLTYSLLHDALNRATSLAGGSTTYTIDPS